MPEWDDNLYRIVNITHSAKGYVNGKLVFTTPKDKKVLTDLRGDVLRMVSFTNN